VLAECEQIAAALDTATGSNLHRDALSTAVAALDDPASTPSARVLQAMARDHNNSYVHFALAQSRAHREAILKLPLSEEVAKRFALQAEESFVEQRRIEAADAVPFETYRQQYLAPIGLNQ
jgi:glutamate--cysteine ligase